MKKIVVTGFEPFNGKSTNPSQRIVEKLMAPKDTVLVKKILPVAYKQAEEELIHLIEKEQPDILLSIGQAGNVPHISVERVALNLDCTRTSNGEGLFADAVGYQPIDVPVIPDAENALYATLPVWELVADIRKKNVPAAVSYHAGTFICNHVMYIGCHLTKKYPHMISGFIHVPFLPEQNPEKGYTMPFEDMLTALQTVINTLAGNL
ncbi:MAG: pyroglutamyl-peptidase I [Erysipelotrichaceae bacterium]|nr:pyroglutamyl-peptidase I [Erysipelotrichaceae bacterium]